MMTRAFFLLALYVVIGTIFTLFGYRIAVEGQFPIPGVDTAADFSSVFVVIALNVAMAFAAAAVLIAMMIPSGVSSGTAMIASALTTGILGAGMLAWYPGLTSVFPVVMVAGGVVCAQTANALGFLNPPGNR